MSSQAENHASLLIFTRQRTQEVVDRALQPRVEQAPLVVFTSVEGNRFRVFSHTHQAVTAARECKRQGREGLMLGRAWRWQRGTTIDRTGKFSPEVGLLCLLLEVEPHQRLADVDRQRGASNGIDEQRAKEGGIDGVEDACA